MIQCGIREEEPCDRTNVQLWEVFLKRDGDPVFEEIVLCRCRSSWEARKRADAISYWLETKAGVETYRMEAM
tara:strand:+ start:8564 stop:8779 length:216 start_codon:yes stop_codon:yes gene_type:complete